MLYFFSAFFMILSTKGSFISHGQESIVILDVVLAFYGIKYNKFLKSDFRLFFKFSAIYIIFITIKDLLLNHLPFEYLIADFNFLIKYFFLAFLYCAVLKELALPYMIKVTIAGAAISLFFYALQLVAPGLVFSLGSWINLFPRSENALYSNFVIFTFDQGHALQNCGFTWEPGAYGCILNLGLLLHLVTNGFRFDRSAKILFIAIITTLSTTSYIALMVLLLLNYRANGGRLTIFMIIAVPVIGLMATQLPFMITKIVAIYNQDLSDINSLDTLSNYYLVHGGQLPLNRFGSFIYIYNLYGYKLLWGITNTYQDYSISLHNVNISNGLIDYIAKFGVVGLVGLLYGYILLLNKFRLKYELIIYCVLVLLLLSFGEPYLIWINILAFFFLYYYTEPDDEIDMDEETNEEGNELAMPAV